MTRSTKLLLLGISLLLFGLVMPQILNALALPIIVPLHVSRETVYLVESIIPLAGIILAFIGFFQRDR